ncbi:MAG TPA: hypothetical protein VKT76_05565 [Bradyrhizobium sp.]|nr:hypothetical protein [Bradyrhizobium sp.]
MRRVFAIAAAGISLAGCSSFSTPDYLKLDYYYKPTPTPVLLQLESTPPGADARTSVGPGCKTPCSVTLNAPDGGFTVNYTMAGREPAAVPVQVIRTEGSLFSSGTARIEPNPAIAELRPLAPPPKPHAPMRPKKKKPKDAATAPAGSAFPNPGPPPGTLTR